MHTWADRARERYISAWSWPIASQRRGIALPCFSLFHVVMASLCYMIKVVNGLSMKQRISVLIDVASALLFEITKKKQLCINELE